MTAEAMGLAVEAMPHTTPLPLRGNHSMIILLTGGHWAPWKKPLSAHKAARESRGDQILRVSKEGSDQLGSTHRHLPCCSYPQRR